jgi:hypothetical protein
VGYPGGTEVEDGVRRLNDGGVVGFEGGDRAIVNVLDESWL